ncbi:Noc2p family-domain-containing protein [Chytridium lagenaria]|nr:Noc2p family-domain-containing protein [Chytridium lagenaria]
MTTSKAKKSTKRFIKNRLKDVVTQRRKNQKDNKWRKNKPLGGKPGPKKDEFAADIDSDEAPIESDDEGEDPGFEMDDDLPDLAGDADFGSDVDDEDEDDVEDIDNLDDLEDDDEDEADEVASDQDDADSADEDEEEVSPIQKEKKQKRKHLREEISEHKRQLEEENDPNLLDFEDDGEDGEEERDDEDDDLDKIMKGGSDEEDDEEPAMEEEEDEDEDSGRELVTKEMVSGWRKQLASTKSLKTARKVILALRAAIAGGESQADENEILVYRIDEKTSLGHCTEDLIPVFNHHLPKKLVKGKIFAQAADDDLLSFVIRQSEGAAIYYACFPKLGKDYLKICGIRPNTTYYFGFVYIRQLAILLRTAMSTRSKDAAKHVYCWQYVHCLRTWARVLANYCEIGSTAEAAGGTFIPIAADVVEVFQSAEFQQKAKTIYTESFWTSGFSLRLLANTRVLGRSSRGAIEEAISVLVDYFDNFAISISYPELIIPVVALVRFGNFSANKEIQQFLESLESNSRFIEDKRSNIDFSPKDADRASMFLNDIDPMQVPLRKYAAIKRKVRETKLAALQAQLAKEDATKGAAGAELRKQKDLEKGRKQNGKDTKASKIGRTSWKILFLSGDDEDEDEMEMEMEGEEEEEEEMEED